MSVPDSPIRYLTALHNEATSKLDYFILGATLAICAYLAQTNPYAQLGMNEETFLLGSLLTFATSAACGYKRLEFTNQIMRMNILALRVKNPMERTLLIEQLGKNRKSHWLHLLRNYLLLFGLASYLTTKVWASYQGNGWVPVS